MATQQRRLERPADRMIAGVCHGLGDYFDIDPAVVRLAFILFTVMGGVGVLAYLVLWIVMPPAGAAEIPGPGAVGAGVRTMVSELREAGRDVRDQLGATESNPAAGEAVPPPPPPLHTHERHRHGSPVLGLLFVILGVWLLLGNLGLLDWASARFVWPVVLIVLGVLLLLRRMR